MTELGPESEAPARIGQVLRDKYTLERVLGVGGMASVYAASHRNGRKVAIKILHRELSVNREVRERFLREGQAANGVGHPGAVAVLDDDVSEDGAAFLVMELLDGGSAEELAERRGGTLPLADVCVIGDQLLEVLDAAHRNGIVHRDIKPANLFITRHGRVKVLDFGIAKVRQTGAARATQTGLMLGTPAFMAPEQALGRVTDVDARTDIWAVGSTLFALATGRSVHEAPTAQETLIYAATKPAPAFTTIMSSAPPELAAVIDRALAFDQSARFPTAAAMREAWNSATSNVRKTASSVDTLSVLLQGFQPRGSEFPASVPSSSTHFAGSRAAGPVDGAAASRATTRRFALVGGIAALLVAALVTAWMLGSRSASERVDAEADASSRAPIAVPAAPASVSVSVVEAAPAIAPAESVSPPPTPADLRRRPARPSTAKSARNPTPTEVPTAAPAPAPKPNCNPPYELDSQGVKILEARLLVTSARSGIALCLTVALVAAPQIVIGAEPAKTTAPAATSATPAPATTATATAAPAAETPATDVTEPPPAPGEPTKEQCIDANETAQRLLRNGVLAGAREQVAVCIAASCPEPIRNDCNEISKAIQTAMPTVRFDARDKAGAPVTNVRVTMDGKPFAENLDGNPLPVDPGKHSFLFESPGLPRTSKTIVLKTGEQRGERVDMIDMTGPLLRTTGLVVAGIGAIAIGYGSYRGIQAKTKYDDALEHCPDGPNACTPAGVQGGEDAHDAAAAATTSIGIGAFLMLGGAALYLFVPEEGFRITPGVRSGGLSIEASKTW